MLNQKVRSASFALLLIPLPLAGVAAVAQTGGGRVTMPVRVLTEDGTPVTDVKAGDVTLKVDGKPREIKLFELVDLRSGSGSAPAPSKVAPPFQTNAAQAPTGRDLFVLVDEESITPGKEVAVQEAAAALLGALSPRDRIALVSVRLGGVNIPLTSDREKITSSVATLAGYGSARENAADLSCRTLRTISALQAVFDAAKPDSPPTVVFFSTALAALQAGQTARMGGEQGSDVCPLRTEQFNQLGAAAQASHASFFVMELMDAGGPPLPQATGGLENLAGVTRGDLIRMGANAAGQMSRIARSTSAYYMVGFEPEASERGSGTKRVDVTLARSGVTVRAPQEIAFAKPAGKGPATPRDMIRVGTAFPDLPLRAAAYSSRNPGDDKVRVLALFEPLEAGIKLKAATIALYDKAGKLTAQWNAQAEDLSRQPAIAALVAAPGDYRVRVAATDASGRPGAVDLQLSAALIEAGPIRLGDLVLGKMTDSGPAPVLYFQTEQEALAMIELYGRPAGPLTAYVEVLQDPEGTALQAIPLSPSATSEQDKFVLSAKIPMAELKPGDYMVRAVVGIQGQEAKVTRTLRKAGS
jgi:hypothetical protein